MKLQQRPIVGSMVGGGPLQITRSSVSYVGFLRVLAQELGMQDGGLAHNWHKQSAVNVNMKLALGLLER